MFPPSPPPNRPPRPPLGDPAPRLRHNDVPGARAVRRQTAWGERTAERARERRGSVLATTWRTLRVGWRQGKGCPVSGKDARERGEGGSYRKNSKMTLEESIGFTMMFYFLLNILSCYLSITFQSEILFRSSTSGMLFSGRKMSSSW